MRCLLKKKTIRKGYSAAYARIDVIQPSFIEREQGPLPRVEKPLI